METFQSKFHKNVSHIADVFFYQQMGSRAISPSQILACSAPLQVPLSMAETYQLSNIAQPILYQGHLETSLPLSHIHGAQWMTDVTVTTIPHELQAENVVCHAKTDVQTQTSLVRRKESTV